MNSLLNNKHSIFGKLGDFWYRQLSTTGTYGVPFARSLSHFTDTVSSNEDILLQLNRLSDIQKDTIKSNFSYKFNPDNIKVINININNRTRTGEYPDYEITRQTQYTINDTGGVQVYNLPTSIGTISSTSPSYELAGDNANMTVMFELEGVEVTLDANEARPLYYIPIPSNIDPISLLVKDRALTVSTSFITGQGYIIFYEKPTELFSDNIIHFLSVNETKSNTYDYTYQVDNMSAAGKYVAQYMRYTHSAEALKLALSEVCNLPILDSESTLESKYETDDRFIYQFSNGQILTAPKYIEHTELTVGTNYEKGLVIGENYIKVISPNTSDATPWYKDTSVASTWLSKGLNLNKISPIIDPLYLMDVTGTFTSNGATAPGATANLKITGLSGAGATAYWTMVRNHEIYSNKFIANIPGVTAGATANCLDLYFNNMLTYNSVIIKLRTRELGSDAHNNVTAFIRRELPVNVTPIILD